MDTINNPYHGEIISLERYKILHKEISSTHKIWSSILDPDFFNWEEFKKSQPNLYKIIIPFFVTDNAYIIVNISQTTGQPFDYTNSITFFVKSDHLI